MLPSWLKLLLLNKRFGLTFPFLIGALREPPGATTVADTARDELTKLLKSMRDDTPASHVIRIAECDRLHQPVAAPIPRGYSPGVGFTAIPSRTSERVSLYVSKQYLVGVLQSIDAVSDSLWNVIAAPVAERHFSFYEGAFHRFDDRDLGFIRDALAMADEDEA